MNFPRIQGTYLDKAKSLAALERIAHFSIAKPSLIYAVLYYADRNHHYYSTRGIYGESYLAYHHAAVPSWANHIYMTLRLPSRDIPLSRELNKRFVVVYPGIMVCKDMTAQGEDVLTQYERGCIDDAMYWYKSSSERDVMLSRRDIPWRQTPQGEFIPDLLLAQYGNQASNEYEPIPEPKEFTAFDSLLQERTSRQQENHFFDASSTFVPSFA